MKQKIADIFLKYREVNYSNSRKKSYKKDDIVRGLIKLELAVKCEIDEFARRLTGE